MPARVRCLVFLTLVVVAHPGVWARAAQPGADAPQATVKSQEPKLTLPALKASGETNRRRIYVLHSGVHTILADPWKNIAADTLREGLIKRGVDDRNIVALDNPYPTATWRNMFPKECLTMFAASAMPTSRTAQEAYLRLHRSLQARGVGPGDDVVWIGHSAGGQMGLTMAYLAKNLDKFPELAKQVAPYRFDMVILLGSPVGSCFLSEDVKLRHYFSPSDKVVRSVARYGPLFMRTFGYRVGCAIMPPSLNPEDRIRIFLGIEHPYWDIDPRVLDRIVAETNPSFRPLWHCSMLAPGLEMSLMRLVTQAISDRYQVSFEDPPVR